MLNTTVLEKTNKERIVDTQSGQGKNIMKKNAYTFKKEHGIDVGMILETQDGTMFRVERPNGFVMSGRTAQNQHKAIDLRNQDAYIVGTAYNMEGMKNWYKKGEMSKNILKWKDTLGGKTS